MSDFDLIKEKIWSAMKDSCNQTLNFSDNMKQKIGAEYLLTVNVAQKISELNENFGDPYKIFLERRTNLFATECIPSFSKVPAKNVMGFRYISRKLLNTNRNGKIDVCVYRGDIPVCAVEVKGFNPSRAEVMKDLVRNTEYFSFGHDTVKSAIDFTVFAAIYSFKNIFNEKIVSENEDRVRDKYKSYIRGLGNLNGISPQEPEVETFSKNIVNEYMNEDGSIEYSLDDNHQFVGVMVFFRKHP